MKKYDLNIGELKKKFAYHLESLKSLTPEGFEELTTFIINLGDKIEELAKRPDKTEQDFIQIEELSIELRSFIRELSEVQIKLRKKDWEDTEAYYSSLKEKAGNGDAEAKQILKEFEPIYFEMQERVRSDEDPSISLFEARSLLGSTVKS